MLKVCFLILSSWILTISGKRQIHIGAIFHAKDHEAEISFRYAVEHVNMHENNFELVPIVKHLAELDSFITEKTVCDLTQKGVAAIFGPSSIQASGIASSICSTMEIPHIITHWAPEPLGGHGAVDSMTLNVYPDSNVLSRALADIISNYHWKTFTIIYETDEGLIQLKDILQIHEPKDNPITVRQLSDDNDHRPLLKEIQASGESRIILDCSPNKVTEVLRQALEVKMLGEYISYFITTMDTHAVDFDEFTLTRTNITSIRLMDPNNFDVKNMVYRWEQGEKRFNRPFRVSPNHVKTEAAVVHDAVQLFASAVKTLNAEREIVTPGISCKNPTQWPLGINLATRMAELDDYGLTGKMIFDENGRRTFFNLDIIELTKEGFNKSGAWNPIDGVSTIKSTEEVHSQLQQSLEGRTLKIAVRVGAPYFMIKNDENLEGNDLYEGYSKDLIHKIAKRLKFKYKFELDKENKYGSYNKETKKWDGLIRILLDKTADIAICDLTITYERRTAVDFTTPFMTLGIGILYAKPIKEPPDYFSFLEPLSLDVWLYMATAYLGVSILIFVLARMAPAEWENPHPCNQEPEEVENIWNMLNCTWLTMGTIMGQGSDILPKAVSTRLVAGVWWFFALIMLSSYTANLAAFLTTGRMESPISGAEDLAKQTKIKYGAVRGGSTLSFFKQSNHTVYSRMWTTMESTRPSVFTDSNDEGIKRVQTSKRTYAFLIESTSLEYAIERNCDLEQVGDLLDSKGYGIATPKNSPYRDLINKAVLNMQETGELLALKTKWWKELNGGGTCNQETTSSADTAAELGIGNVGGVFVVLASGCLVALIIGILEFLWNVRKVAVEEKITPTEAFKEEIRFAFKFWISTKPVHKHMSESLGSKRSSKSRAISEARSAANVLQTTPSILNLEKLGAYFQKEIHK